MKKIANYYPTLKESWMLFGVLLAAMWVGGTLFAPIKMILHGGDSWIFLLSYLFSFGLLVSFIQVYLSGNPDKLGDEPLPARNITISLFILLFIAIPCLSLLLEPLSAWIPYPSGYNFGKLLKDVLKPDFPIFLAVVVAAPVLEEWLFRGVILKGLLKHTTPWKAILWSALMFGLMHLNPWQGIPAFGMAILFGWVYWRTRSLWVCVFMHFVNNGMAFLLLFLFPDMHDTATIFDNNSYIYALLMAAAVLLPTLFLLYQKIGKEKRD